MNQRISIIIPAYNEARHLPACLDAIAAQIVAPDEVIVVDNNSTDATVAAAKRYPFVRVIHERRQGIVFARNAGFDAAAGDLLARIDADTHLPADWVATVLTLYGAGRDIRTVLTGGCSFYNLRSGRIAGRLYDLVVHRFNRVLLGYYFPWGSNSVLPREAWRAVRPNVLERTDIHEDLDLGIHLDAAGFRTRYITRLRVATQMKRVLSRHGELWPYLMWWPQTYRANGLAAWPVVWPLVIIVWLGSYGIIANERLLRLFAGVRRRAAR